MGDSFATGDEALSRWLLARPFFLVGPAVLEAGAA